MAAVTATMRSSPSAMRIMASPNTAELDFLITRSMSPVSTQKGATPWNFTGSFSENR